MGFDCNHNNTEIELSVFLQLWVLKRRGLVVCVHVVVFVRIALISSTSSFPIMNYRILNKNVYKAHQRIPEVLDETNGAEGII